MIEQPTVLLTRPEGRNAPLANALSSHQIRYSTLALLKICPIPFTCNASYDTIIFISPSAVLHYFSQQSSLPNYHQLFAVGKRTAELLQSHGYQASYPSNDESSAGILALLGDISDQSIAIVRGEGGLEHLHDALTPHNQISYIEVYKRVCPDYSHQTFKRQLSGVNIICCTSGESLQNLIDLSQKYKQHSLVNHELIVPSERIQKLATANGFANVHVTNSASDPAMLSAILKITRTQNERADTQ